jgi:adenylate cyclase
VWGQLVVVEGSRQGVIFPLRHSVVNIGRAGDNDIVLQDASVSGHHARIEQRGPQVFLVDMNSSNGTLVNGQRVQQAQLTGGETIRLGDTHLRIEMLR